MRFSFARKDLICKYSGCKGTIQRGDICVRTFYSNKSGFRSIFCYHLECFLKGFEERFNKSCLYWMQQQVPPKKLGRPPIPCSDRPKRRRLLSLMIYHKHLGNTSRVEEIQKEIEVLERRE